MNKHRKDRIDYAWCAFYLSIAAIMAVLGTGCSYSPVVFEGDAFINTPTRAEGLPPPLPPRKITPDEREIMERIFRGVKGEFVYVKQTNDGWNEPLAAPLEGDCDDFAGAICTLARLHNIPCYRVTGYTGRGIYHMAAFVDGIVYDNRMEWPTPWEFVHYQWHLAETTKGWVKIND